MSGAKTGEQVADICAGTGGKTLALAAMMENKGQIHAHDADKHRLRPIFERLQRAGVRNVQVIGAEEGDRCTRFKAGWIACSSMRHARLGSWRRKPDAKWRLTEKQLSARTAEQRAVLAQAALLVTGGRLVYITCSVLPEENGDQVTSFLADHSDFGIAPYREQWRAAIGFSTARFGRWLYRYVGADTRPPRD